MLVRVLKILGLAIPIYLSVSLRFSTAHISTGDCALQVTLKLPMPCTLSHQGPAEKSRPVKALRESQYSLSLIIK